MEILFVELIGINGVENKSRTSTDSSVWRGGDEDFIVGISCKSANGFDDDIDDNSSRSCSCSDKDGVETDEAIDDERCFLCLEESI